MKNLIGIGISVGALAGIWTQVSIELALITWVGFVAWACYFAAGGGREGFRKGLAANLAGALWGYLASLVLTYATFTGAVALVVTVVAFILCLQAAVDLLSFIPGAFAGTAVFFGTSFDLGGTLIALVVGALLGWLSDIAGRQIQATVERAGQPIPSTPRRAR
ncbi:DUF1097 domain-containing protein [Nocardioides sp. NBC_00368]|uniref:DUF1097 domain-containing protein n=1 Tax=Nocardioides sp. NBC_00368 TaxID=2976000 RepID=UPI002E1AB013